MARILRTAAMLWLLVTYGVGLPTGTAAASAQIRTQAPCTGPDVYCEVFALHVPAQFDFRTFTFKAPGKGSAEVGFHGSMVCDGDGTAGNKVVDLVTQIVNSPSATAAPDQPGGLRQALVLQPNTSDTVNLASTRVFSFKGSGTQTYYYRVRPLRIDSGATCSVYNSAFTVVFIP